MSDLSTTYLGLALRTPLVASASPLTGTVDGLRALEAAGVSAVVLPSLFEEQIIHEALDIERMLDAGTGFAESADGFFPQRGRDRLRRDPTLEDYNTGPTCYLRHVEAAKAKLEVPVIASLNGASRGGWVRHARLLEAAGADAIELNVYRVAADPAISGRAVEAELLDLVRDVAEQVTVPLAVKLGPYYSALASLAPQIVAAGASGLVLFNRFYQPDIDLTTLEVGPRLVLSTSEELRLPLRWLAILHGRIAASLAATTGIHTANDVVKALLAGADVTMLASALLRHGPDHVHELEVGLLDWLVERGYRSVRQLKGSVSQRTAEDPEAFERANYLTTLTRFSSTFLI